MNHKSQPPRGNPPREQSPRTARGPDDAKLRAILEHKPDRIDELAQELVAEIRDLGPTQLRNFYTPLVKLRAELASGKDLSRDHGRLLWMHKARIAYMSAREGKAKPLFEWFDGLVKRAAPGGIADRDKLKGVCDFAEAVVAYHTAARKAKGDRE